MDLFNPHEKGQNWKPWSMEALEIQMAPSANVASADRQKTPKTEQSRLQDAEFLKHSEIKALRDKARDDARQEGYEAGFACAQEAGFAEGLAQGINAGEQQLREKSIHALEPIRHLALGFSTALNSIEQEMGEQIARIALKIGQQLAIDAIKEHPEAILSLVRSVLRSDPEMIGKPRLRANPEDMAMIKDEFGNEIESLGWQLISDDQITRGGCKVISNNGEIDATWESRWASVLQEYQREMPVK